MDVDALYSLRTSNVCVMHLIRLAAHASEPSAR